MSKNYLTPTDLAPHLGWSARTLRRAVASAAESRRLFGKVDAKFAALLSHSTTPGDFIRWDVAQAEAVLRAFGRPVPKKWPQKKAAKEGCAS